MINKSVLWDIEYYLWEEEDYGLDVPPTKLVSDWFEMAYLLVLFCLSAPINGAAWTLLNEKRNGNTRMSVRRLETLKRNLNYSDLLMTFVYLPTRICWNLTYRWQGGPVLCKFVRFGYFLSFQSSSNMIVCISLDRIFSIVSPSSAIHSARAERRVKVMIITAWFIAITLSLPTFITYHVFPMSKDHPDWHQCISIWEYDRMNSFVEKFHSILDNVAVTRSFEHNLTSQFVRQMHAKSNVETTLAILHLVCVFFVPLLIIVGCYLLVWLYISRLPEANTVSIRKSSLLTTSVLQSRQAEALSAIRSKAKRMSDAGMSLLSRSRKRHSFSLDGLKTLFLRKALQHKHHKLYDSGVDAMSLNHTNTTAADDSLFASCAEDDSVYLTVGHDSYLPCTSPRSTRHRSCSDPSLFYLDVSTLPPACAVKFNVTTGSLSDLSSKPEESSTSDTRRLHHLKSPRVSFSGAAMPHGRKGCAEGCAGDVSTLSARSSECFLHKNVHKVKRNALRVSGLLVTAYIVCWLPYNVISLCCIFWPHLMDAYKRSIYVLKDLVALNAVINPFLYGMFGSLKRCIRTG